jgi:deoxyribonuclease-4
VKYIGAHVSAEGGVENAPLNAVRIGASAFALFTRNQRRWESPPYSESSVKKFKENLTASLIRPENVLAHDSYLINIGSPEDEGRAKSLAALLDECRRVEQLGLLYLNLHPGSHLKKITEEESLDYVAAGISYIQSSTEYMIPVLETTAGQGSNLGAKFEHLRYIIDRVKDSSRIGVCIDTCHIYSAGYDISTPERFDAVMKEFDAVIGLKYLKGMHLNDSLVDFNSKKDRHQSLGAGTLGLEPFRFIMKDPRFDCMPLILETIDESKWADEINTLYDMAGERP